MPLLGVAWHLNIQPIIQDDDDNNIDDDDDDDDDDDSSCLKLEIIIRFTVFFNYLFLIYKV